jgi:hypothetical protein
MNLDEIVGEIVERHIRRVIFQLRLKPFESRV